MLDKTSIIGSLISERALCLECLATKTEMKPDAVNAALSMLGRAVKIDRYPAGTCVECGTDGLVFAIDRPR